MMSQKTLRETQMEWDHLVFWSLPISRSLAWSPSKFPCADTKTSRVLRGHPCYTTGALCEAWQGPGSSAPAVGAWVHPRLRAGWCLLIGTSFQLLQIAPTGTQSPCFVIKTRRKITSKGILPISLSTYSTEIILTKQTPKTGHQNNKVAKKLV